MLTMNQLENKSLKGAIEDVLVKSGTSKDGNPYTYLEIIYINGWKQRAFLNDDQKFGFLNACELLKSRSEQKSDILAGSQPVESSTSPF